MREARKSKEDARQKDKEIAALKVAAARLTEENLKMYAQIQPRRISPEQKQSMALFFQSHPPGKVLVITTGFDTEAAFFAYQLVEALNFAGCEATRQSNTYLGGPFLTGVLISVPSDGQPVQAHAIPIKVFLESIGIDVGFIDLPLPTAGDVTPDVLKIFIGAKPFPPPK
jgi:hypothetical protein